MNGSTASPTQAKVDTLIKDLHALSAEVQGDDASRQKLLGATMGAMAQLESPLETVWRMIMQPHAPSALMSLIKMGAVKQLAEAGKPMTAAELGKATGGDPLLIVRLCRPLTQMGIVKEVDAETYEATGVTKILTDPVLLGAWTFMYTVPGHALTKMPEYLEKEGFKNVNGHPGPFQYARDTQLPMFPWLIQDHDLMSHFNRFMSGQRMLRVDWFKELDVDKMFLSGAKTDKDAVLMVDVGGGEGHDIERFHQAFPTAPGKLVLQDLPQAIDNIKELDPYIVRQGHDFFTPQPVKGARVYYFRSILHDWPDADCIKILRETKAAMEPGYSKLYLNEFVLPAKNVPLYPALLDINMMAILNGMERTQKQWTELLNAAGFKPINFHVDPAGDKEGLIEAELL